MHRIPPVPHYRTERFYYRTGGLVELDFEPKTEVGNSNTETEHYGKRKVIPTCYTRSSRC